MDYHEALKIAGGAGTLAMFIPMTAEVIKRSGAGQSLSTWLLWTMLDTILTVSTMARHGNFLLPMGYAVGGWVLTGLLLAKVKFAWSRLDNVILVLVLGCLVGWKLGGARTAIVAATLAVCLAGIPGLLELWQRPNRMVGTIWIGYALTNTLSFFGGTAMTVEERLAPGAFAGISLLMFIASRRRNINPKPL